MNNSALIILTSFLIPKQLKYVMYFTVLYCTVLYGINCTVLYCTVLYCTVLYCTVLYCTVLYCSVLYCTVLYYKYCTVLYCMYLPYCSVLYCTVLYQVTLYLPRIKLTRFPADYRVFTRFRKYKVSIPPSNKYNIKSLFQTPKSKCEIKDKIN